MTSKNVAQSSLEALPTGMRAKRIVNTYAAAGSVEQLFSFDLKQLDAAGLRPPSVRTRIPECIPAAFWRRSWSNSLAV